MKLGKIITLVTTVVLLLIASVGISYAWFSQRAAMATLLDILPPDSINIIPIDAETGLAMTELDLDFDEDFDDKDKDTGAITIRRPICIKSTSPVHQLEVVHTTNLNDLSFNIYPTTLDASGNVIVPNVEIAHKIVGDYKNETGENPGLAIKENLNNYEAGDTVEAHAYPLYWLAVNSGDKSYVDNSDWDNNWTNVESTRNEEFDSAKQDYKYYYYTYYYLEIKWQESTKETDLFYVMAQNIAVTAIEEGSGTTP